MEAVLAASCLTYSYPNGTQALCGINLDIRPGERVALLGPNGSGKSTLFLCLNGVHRAGPGMVLLDGAPVTYEKASLQRLRKDVGIVFQDPETQLFCVDVFQEAAFGPHNLGWPKERVEATAQKSLAAMDLLALRDTPPHYLSGGQKKRVSVASVLSMEPRVLLFDEPVSALDPLHARSLLEEMDRLAESGVAIIMATHDVDGALAWADRTVLLRGGAVECDAPPVETFLDEALLARCGLEMPAVLRIWNAMKAAGTAPEGAPPRSAEELARRITEHTK